MAEHEDLIVKITVSWHREALDRQRIVAFLAQDKLVVAGTDSLYPEGAVVACIVMYTPVRYILYI